jgi:hypothetical protein
MKAILTLALAIMPLYIFRSGSIQPGHLGLIIAAVLIFLRMKPVKVNWSMPFLLLILYTFLVEAYYGIATVHGAGVVNVAFLIFNYVVALAVAAYVARESAIPVRRGWALAAAVALAGVVVLGFSLSVDAEGNRSVGTFNNPNQLGYFSVCLASVAVALNHAGELGKRSTVLAILVSAFLAVTSLSKAAMVANFVNLGLVLAPRRRGGGGLALLVIGMGIAAAAVYAMLETGVLEGFRFYDRLLNMANESDSSLESRGYFLFLDANVAEIFFGLGSLQVRELLGHEVHSTISSIHNSYGIIGLLLICAVLGAWGKTILKGFGVAGLLQIWLPSMLYGITHNGIRFTFFWVLVAISTGLALRRRRVGFRPEQVVRPMAARERFIAPGDVREERTGFTP